MKKTELDETWRYSGPERSMMQRAGYSFFPQEEKKRHAVQVDETLAQRRSEQRGAMLRQLNTHHQHNTATAISLLKSSIANREMRALGDIRTRTDIPSSIRQFYELPEYKTTYPRSVVDALGALYQEYNRSFGPLVEANRESPTDYGRCMTGSEGTPVNSFVQIDMVGLPDGFLQEADRLGTDAVTHVLRRHIFEIENSLAMYQLLSHIFEGNGRTSFFAKEFRASLDELRQRYDMPVALLPVTNAKYHSMKRSEFGKEDTAPLSDAEVRALSGFDRLFSPESFKAHLAENNGQSRYLLYVRSSDPVSKLRKPSSVVMHELLDDPEIRQAVKAHAITLNIDAPDMTHAARINDTKEYQPSMGMGFAVHSEPDLFGSDCAEYLRLYCIDPSRIASGDVRLRGKPEKGAYGCYGHVSGKLSDRKFCAALAEQIRDRGAYIIQPEMPSPVIRNASDGKDYTYIDRNFFACTNGSPRFLGGFRSLMPVDSEEVQKGRNHGSASTIWAEITHPDAAQ